MLKFEGWNWKWWCKINMIIYHLITLHDNWFVKRWELILVPWNNHQHAHCFINNTLFWNFNNKEKNLIHIYVYVHSTLMTIFFIWIILFTHPFLCSSHSCQFLIIDLLQFIWPNGRKLRGCVRSKNECVDSTTLFIFILIKKIMC